MQTGQSLKIKSGADFPSLTWKSTYRQKHTQQIRRERNADRQTQGMLKADN